MKTEIKQSEPEFLIRIEDRPKGLMIVQDDDNWVYVEKENIKQLALILCPELSQPELKAVKTAEEFIEDSNLIWNCKGDPEKDCTEEGDLQITRDALVEILNNFANQLPKEEQPEKIVSELKSQIEKLKEKKLHHELFIGKVAELIGLDKATALLKESIDAFKTK